MIKSKSKAILVLIFLMMISVIVGLSTMTGIAFADSGSGDFESGYGTKENPYKITSVEEFNNIRNHPKAYFEQTDNLDFANSEFAPIGSATFPFAGYYNGGKYQISNIRIKQNTNNVGLFASVTSDGVIENLKVVNAEIEGEYNVGAIVGTNRGKVIGCISTANVSGSGSVGGIVGLNAVGGQVIECGNLGIVSSIKIDGMYVGGIAGINNALIQDCYNHGNINSDQNAEVIYSGGIVGLNDGTSHIAEINHCYTIGKITGKARGQIAGDNLNGKISDCKWQASELNKATSFYKGGLSNVVVLDKNGFNSKSSFSGWNFDNIWMYIDSKSDYPLLNREYVQVESVSFKKNIIEIQPGNTVKLKPIVMPKHSTVNEVKLELKNSTAGVKLSTEHELSIAKSVEPGTVVRIKATIEEKSTELTVKVVKIPVESVKLTNIDGKNEISQLHGLHFKGEAYPVDASYKTIEYKVDSSFAEITADGFLTLKENAPTNTKITVSAISVDNPMKSDSITVTVVKEAVTSVTINSENNFKVTSSLKLSATVLPDKATYKDVSYKIISSTAEGANLINNVLTATGLGTITVVAEADGVKSETFTVQVIKEPVTDIVWNTADSFTCGDIIVLSATAVPNNATFGEITYSIVGDNNAQATIIDGILCATTAGTVTVRAIADGFICDKEITISKIPVDSIELDFEDSFKHTESLELTVNVLPDNATYKNDIVYEIITDSADSKIESGILYAEKPGSVTVKVTVDGISATKTVSVLKEAVQSVILNAVYEESDLGETYQFVANVYPANATNQDVTYILKSGDATLSLDGLLIIDSSIPEGSLIEVYAVVDGIESSVYEIKSGRIDVESVSLASETDTIKVGEGVNLITSTVPAVVSNPGVTYILDGNAEIIDGVLYVTDVAAVGTTIRVKAVVDGVESDFISVTVVETPVENLTFTCATSFKVTESLKLSASVYPQNATDKSVTFTVISGAEIDAEIVDGYLYAEKVGVVKVRAVAGNVSRDVVICVQKEPVTRVVLTSAMVIKVNNTLNLTATAYPFNATYKDITFELINNSINAEIIEGNKLFSSQVGKVTLRVNSDGTYEDYEIEITKEPVTEIVFGAKSAFKHTESLTLVTRVLPTNATYNEVTYSILKDYAGYKEIGAYIENGKLYANEPGLVKLLVTTDNGEYSEIIEIDVTKEPVIGINMANNDIRYLDYGYRVGQIDLQTVVYPSNATYQDVKYDINCVNCSFVRNGNIVTVTLDTLLMSGNFAADEQASINVKAEVDGVEFNRTYVFNKFDLADKEEIILNPVNRTFKTSGKFDFNISLPDKLTYKNVKIEILDPNNTGVKFVHTNDNSSIEIDTSNVESLKLTAKKPGTVILKITSLCSNVSEEFEITVEKEKVHNAVLGLQVTADPKLDHLIYKEGEQAVEAAGRYTPNDTQDWKSYDAIEVQQGSEMMFRGFGYAEDKTLHVTYGDPSDFTLRFYKDNENITDKAILNDYLSVQGNTIKIALNAPVKTDIYVCVVAQNGLESNRTKLTIQFAYINEIKNLKINSEGVITGLEYIETANIEKVSVSIKHSSTGIVLTKEINTQFPTVILQLYNSSMGGYFDVEYEVFFKQNLSNNSTHRYSYKRTFQKDASGDNSFKGLSGKYSPIENYKKEFSSIVWLDNNSNTSSSYWFRSEVKVVYVYNSYVTTKTTNFMFNNDSNNTTDFYLDKFSFNSTAGNDAITVYNGGGFNLITKGNIKITAADGGNGQNVLNMPNANLTISNNGLLTLKAGNGANGNNGTTYDRSEENGGSGTAPSGGDGTSGGNGGVAIKCSNLNLSTANGSLSISGGNGGNGGTGGNGHGSDRDGRPKAGNGGRGGAGGAGGAAIDVAHGFTLNVSANSLNIVSGNGGHGGDGGHGGHGRASHYSDHGGDGGVGGRAGAGGNAISATLLKVESISGSISIVTGSGGQGGDGGDGGKGYDSWGKADNGSGANGGDSGNSGSVSVINFSGNKTLFNNYISIGSVYSGGAKGVNATENGNPATGNPVNGNAGSAGTRVR